MKSALICGIVLCVLLSSVHSATYYYRIGREVIVPSVDEEVVKEVVAAELKKDGLAIVEESAPVVADAPRADPSPAANLESLEVVPAAGNPLKAATVSETVKNAAIEAVRSENVVAEVAEEQKIAVEEPKKEAEPEVKKESTEQDPAVRQQPTIIQQAQETFQNLLNNNPIANAINSIRNPTTSGPNVADAVEQAASVVADATTARPANPIIQSIQNTLNNIGGVFQRTTTGPVVAPVESDMKIGDETVPIIQQSSQAEPINNKVDLTKSA